MIDFTIALYAFEIGICLFIFILFLWWSLYKWKWKHKITSPMYLAVMLFFLFQAWAMLVGLNSRMNRVERAIELQPYMYSFWWDTRILGRIVAEIMIGYIQGKIIYIEFFRDKNIPRRRRGDELGEDFEKDK